MPNTAYEDAWNAGGESDQPLVDAVNKARQQGADERQAEFVRAHRELDSIDANGQPKGERA